MNAERERVRVIIAEHLCVDDDKVVPEASLATDLNADSLDLVELAMAFEDEFRVEIPDDEIRDLKTVQDCFERIEAGQRARAA